MEKLATFEEKIDVINNELRKRKGKWQLKARADLDFEDVEQIIRVHIFRKWSLWDQTQPLEPWLNRIITRQISNLLRNLYGGFSRPCLKCAANQGGELCAIYKTQCVSCPLYAKWVKGKKQAHDVKIPLPLENHSQEVESISADFLDYESAAQIIHSRIKPKLTKVQYQVYDMLYIQNLSEDEIAMKMGYKKTEDLKRKGIRYKQLENYKKKFVSIGRRIIEEEDLA
jgi:DNA-directed RNA polymerase specialized sigma24 family protein